MDKIMKRFSVIALAVIMTVAFMPVGLLALGVQSPTVEKAYAGEGMSIDGYVYGLNSDGQTVDPGQKLYVNISDLNNIYSGLKDYYLNGDVDICWGKADDDEYTNSQKAKTYVDSGKICTDVTIGDSGKWYTLYVDSHDTDIYPNLNSGEHYQAYGTANIENGPTLSTSYYRTVNGVGKNSYKFLINSPYYFTIKFKEHYYYEYNLIVKLSKNGAVIKTATINGKSEVPFNSIPVSYGKTDNFKVQLFLKLGSSTVSGPAITFTDTSAKLGKNKVRATKISKNKVIVKWNGCDGASGYYVYMGKKKVKTLSASKKKFTVKKKNAYKYKYKVIPYVKVGTKKYKGTSTAAKPKKNQLKLNRSVNYGSASYSTCPFRITKISLKGNTYTITGYAVNNRIYPMARYKNFKLALYVDGKKAFSKKWRTKKIGVKDSSSKRIVIKVKGRAGVDLANYNYISYTESGTPVWVWHGKVMKPL